MHDQIIEKALEINQSVEAIANRIGMNPGNLRSAFRAKKLPAWVACKLAKEAGIDPVLATLEGLQNASRSDAEAEHWRTVIKQYRTGQSIHYPQITRKAA